MSMEEKYRISEINREETPPDIDKKESLLQRRESLLPICPSLPGRTPPVSQMKKYRNNL